MFHRHLNHSEWTLAAIDDCIARGRLDDWKELRDAATKHTEIREKILRVAKPYLSILCGSSKELLGTIAGATGLDLSVTTLRNISHVAQGKQEIEKLTPYGQNPGVFMEVLGVDYPMAFRLTTHFRRAEEHTSLEEIEGITPKLIEQIKHYFAVET